VGFVISWTTHGEGIKIEMTELNNDKREIIMNWWDMDIYNDENRRTSVELRH